MKAARWFWLLPIAAAGLSAAIVDRIAVTVENQVITQSEVLREIRLAAFLNGEPAVYNAEVKRRTAERLVERVLLRREMEITRYSQPGEAQAEAALRQVQTDLFAGDAVRCQDQLRRYGLTEVELKQHLLRQVATLRFIETRFKPEVQVSEGEIRRFYDDELLPGLRRRNVKPEPSYDEARAQCEEALLERGADKAADAWLADGKKRARIRYREDVFQ